MNPLPADARPTRSLVALLADWATAVADRPGAQQPPVYDGPDVTLNGVAEHTDDVAAGVAFFARVRTASDGHPYIGAALARGATVVFAERPAADVGVDVPAGVPYLVVPDTAEALAWLSAAWYRFPGRELTVIGITGTDGKTSTANLTHAILNAAGLRAGLLSTLRAVIGGAEEPLALHVTTPEAPVLQRYLRRMVDAGLTHCVLEVTSHALAQHRVTGVDFTVAAVTNISHEHIDYHGDHAGYVAAKRRLFEMTATSPGTHGTPTAVLNRDDPSFDSLRKVGGVRQLLYTIRYAFEIDGASVPGVQGEGRPGLFAAGLQFEAERTRFNLYWPAISADNARPGVPVLHPPEAIPIETTLVGEFNIYNMLAAATIAYALPETVTPAEVKSGLESVGLIHGRMHRIDRGQPFLTIVDFAHTPYSLEQAIAAARRMAPDGRILTVFGSAGKRDVAKRRMMAEVAAKTADIAILTAEDPRTESLDNILAMMAAAAHNAGGIEGTTFFRIPDRSRAIHHALTLASPADVVLICGKGHEQSMCFGTVEYPWDDVTATAAALDAYQDGRPAPDSGLPTAGN